ncbi:MAG TPA: HAMP domain-containing sensor histidine kinase, partial [Lacipirellulaceae bacterium]|nr:HAMP domain-containing sensor histidine kinase [Lacipirellulaceae bacterium]
SPLSIIRGYIELFYFDKGMLNDEHVLFLDEMTKSISRMQNILDDILSLERLDDHKVFEPVNLNAIVESALKEHQGQASLKQQAFTFELCEELLTIDGNEAQIYEAVSNLIGNAIKYTPSGGRVTVALAADPEQRMARLSISDNGPGIDASDQGAIFDRFFRTDRARSRDETRGAGLGLSICRSVVEAHQGAIRCQSTLGAGTTMIVELPLADARARPITQPHREA